MSSYACFTVWIMFHFLSDHLVMFYARHVDAISFENVTAVLFVAAISEYDQVLYEDENTNRIVEALNLFEEICNSRWFRETSMILFLNKRDLFAEKIARVPLNQYFEEYTGGDDIEAAREFMQHQ